MASEPEVTFFFDSDALLQILLAGQQQLFRILQEDFGVSSFLMSEVAVEVRSSKKLAGLVKPQFEKALNGGGLKILTSSDLERLSGTTPPVVSLGDIRALGKDYALYVDTGDAYTHAAGVLLNCPTVSNDMNALRSLAANSKRLPPNVFRSYDLFGFLLNEGYITVKTAEQVLKTMKTQLEWIPRCFLHSSFRDGLANLHCRLSTSLSLAAGGGDWTSTFYLQRSTKAKE